MSKPDYMIEIDDILKDIDGGKWNLRLIERVQDPENAESTIIDIKCHLAEEIKAELECAIFTAIKKTGGSTIKVVSTLTPEMVLP